MVLQDSVLGIPIGPVCFQLRNALKQHEVISGLLCSGLVVWMFGLLLLLLDQIGFALNLFAWFRQVGWVLGTSPIKGMI